MGAFLRTSGLTFLTSWVLALAERDVAVAILSDSKILRDFHWGFPPGRWLPSMQPLSNLANCLPKVLFTQSMGQSSASGPRPAQMNPAYAANGRYLVHRHTRPLTPLRAARQWHLSAIPFGSTIAAPDEPTGQPNSSAVSYLPRFFRASPSNWSSMASNSGLTN